MEFDTRIIESGSTVMICGPTNSGKTTICLGLLKYRDEIFKEKPLGIVYFYSEMQEGFKEDLGTIYYHQGMPDPRELEEYIARFEGGFFIMVFDDLFGQMNDSEMVTDIITKYSHHRNFSCITLTQNIFSQGSQARNQSVNAHCYILTRTTRDLKQISILGQQMRPGIGKHFLAMYQDAVDNPLSPEYPPFLCVACHPRTDRKCQFLANLLPPEAPKVLYRL